MNIYGIGKSVVTTGNGNTCGVSINAEHFRPIFKKVLLHFDGCLEEAFLRPGLKLLLDELINALKEGK